MVDGLVLFPGVSAEAVSDQRPRLPGGGVDGDLGGTDRNVDGVRHPLVAAEGPDEEAVAELPFQAGRRAEAEQELLVVRTVVPRPERRFRAIAVNPPNRLVAGPPG